MTWNNQMAHQRFWQESMVSRRKEWFHTLNSSSTNVLLMPIEQHGRDTGCRLGVFQTTLRHCILEEIELWQDSTAFSIQWFKHSPYQARTGRDAWQHVWPITSTHDPPCLWKAYALRVVPTSMRSWGFFHLNQCWLIAYWTLGNKLEGAVCTIVIILYWPKGYPIFK